MGTLVAFSGEVNDPQSGPEPFSETSKTLNPGLNGRDIRDPEWLRKNPDRVGRVRVLKQRGTRDKVLLLVFRVEDADAPDGWTVGHYIADKATQPNPNHRGVRVGDLLAQTRPGVPHPRRVRCPVHLRPLVLPPQPIGLRGVQPAHVHAQRRRGVPKSTLTRAQINGFPRQGRIFLPTVYQLIAGAAGLCAGKLCQGWSSRFAFGAVACSGGPAWRLGRYAAGNGLCLRQWGFVCKPVPSASAHRISGTKHCPADGFLPSLGSSRAAFRT